MSKGLFLVRSVDGVRRHEGAVDLALTAVRYWPLDPEAGLLTTEDPDTQGLERNLPNAPDLPGSPPETRPATLRLRAAGPASVRLTLAPRERWEAADDGLADGILLDSQPEGAPFDLRVDEREIRLSTGAITLVIGRRPFRWSLLGSGDRQTVRSGGDRRQVAGFPLAPALAFGEGRASCSLELGPDEEIVGFGEQFGPFVHNGQRLVLLADDALGAGTGRTYKAAPVFHSSSGYTAFLHGPGPITADVGARFPAVLQLDSEEERIDLFLLAAPSVKERLTALTALTGRSPVPPRWAFGVWMSRCRYRDREELEVAAAGMRAHQVPCDILHVDPDWLERDLLNCDFVWSERKYPDAAGLVAALAADGYRVSLWELPYLDPASPVHGEAERLGYLVKEPDGGTAAVSRSFSKDGRPRALVDFSNPDARAWWRGLHARLLELGVAVFKTDFGEGLPDDAMMADGRPGRSWRNLYPLWYNRTVWEAIGSATGRTAFVWGRSGWAGSQRYPGQWGGDPEASVAGMAAELRGGLSWALSAPGIWGHDIGGFYGDGPSPELYVRWAQFGCLSPLTRFHGLTPREPWAFGERALSIVREFCQLRYQLLPYLLSAAGEAARFGWPMLRPLCLEFPEDPASWRTATEYLLGPDLLVVPVLDDSPDPVTVRCTLPPGGWVDWWTGSPHDGPAVIEQTVPLERVPLFVRAGAVVPMGPGGSHTGEIPEGRWTLHCWPGPARPTVVYDGDLALRYRLEAPGAAIGVAGAGVTAVQAGVTAVQAEGTGVQAERTAVQAEEPVPRAESAVLHEAGGVLRPLPLVRREAGHEATF